MKFNKLGNISEKVALVLSIVAISSLSLSAPVTMIKPQTAAVMTSTFLNQHSSIGDIIRKHGDAVSKTERVNLKKVFQKHGISTEQAIPKVKAEGANLFFGKVKTTFASNGTATINGLVFRLYNPNANNLDVYMDGVIKRIKSTQSHVKFYFFPVAHAEEGDKMAFAFGAVASVFAASFGAVVAGTAYLNEQFKEDEKGRIKCNRQKQFQYQKVVQETDTRLLNKGFKKGAVYTIVIPESHVAHLLQEESVERCTNKLAKRLTKYLRERAVLPENVPGKGVEYSSPESQ